MRVLTLLILLLSLSLASSQVIDLTAGTIDGRDLCSMTVEDVKDVLGVPYVDIPTILYYRDNGLIAWWLAGDERLSVLEIRLTPTRDIVSRRYYSEFTGALKNPDVTNVWHIYRIVYEYNGMLLDSDRLPQPTAVIRGPQDYSVSFRYSNTSNLIHTVEIRCLPPSPLLLK